MTRDAGIRTDLICSITTIIRTAMSLTSYFAEMPDEHKSHNIVELENGQIGAYPNGGQLILHLLTRTARLTSKFRRAILM